MNRIECQSCEDLVETYGRVITLPFICDRCEKDSSLAIEEEDTPYNSGVPCQSVLDSVQAEKYIDPYAVSETDPRVHAMYALAELEIALAADGKFINTLEVLRHSSDLHAQFDADTELINGLIAEADDLRMQLDQANKNVQVQGEMIADLENTLDAYRIIFRIPGY